MSEMGGGVSNQIAAHFFAEILRIAEGYESQFKMEKACSFILFPFLSKKWRII